MARQLTAIIEREDDMYVALCPELDIASQGETRQDAIANIKDAIEQCIAVLEEDGLPVPVERFEMSVVVV